MLRSEKDPTIFTSYEAYKSEEDFQAHLRAPYVREWLEKSRPMMTDDGIIFPSHSNLYPNNPEK
ncbi:MAG: antibiotic biosynthesis monooxygenase [Chitinophagaceae bacterium]|nr:antibiotic biosynthesis monooxygenase [Anaerolineae bacterium]